MTTDLSRREAEALEDHDGHHTNAINHELYGGGGDESNDAEEDGGLHCPELQMAAATRLAFHATTLVPTQIKGAADGQYKGLIHIKEAVAVTLWEQ